MIKFKEREITDIEVNVGDEEYDELGMDSVVESAVWEYDGKELTDEELEELNDDQDLMYKIVQDHLY